MNAYRVVALLTGLALPLPGLTQAISRKSNEVLRKMGAEIQWVQSYVTADKIYCVYRAESEDVIRRHAKAGGFPANNISRVSVMIDPGTGD